MENVITPSKCDGVQKYIENNKLNKDSFRRFVGLGVLEFGMLWENAFYSKVLLDASKHQCTEVEKKFIRVSRVEG